MTNPANSVMIVSIFNPRSTQLVCLVNTLQVRARGFWAVLGVALAIRLSKTSRNSTSKITMLQKKYWPFTSVTRFHLVSVWLPSLVCLANKPLSDSHKTILRANGDWAILQDLANRAIYKWKQSRSRRLGLQRRACKPPWPHKRRRRRGLLWGQGRALILDQRRQRRPPIGIVTKDGERHLAVFDLLWTNLLSSYNS